MNGFEDRRLTSLIVSDQDVESLVEFDGEFTLVTFEVVYDQFSNVHIFQGLENSLSMVSSYQKAKEVNTTLGIYLFSILLLSFIEANLLSLTERR